MGLVTRAHAPIGELISIISVEACVNLEVDHPSALIRGRLGPSSHRSDIVSCYTVSIYRQYLQSE